ncbi:DCC1-like thiol-disulfide oxidoreductase family protein [Marinobacterium rhizophilum]|uniref:DCC1-like thiol-disulfide oxidoreductase family protein n=1 Tax=Marinobacterium rhizophilum TaxID=420402 RepID=UPI0003657DF3|nr:DCC1-like thiol-disulfide oxidoreductase family protein [Marinobacterium rhizophilum]
MPELLLIYDKECPFCDRYCRLVRIRAAVGTLRLVNARESSELMAEVTAAGLDIDQGMVLKMGGRLYYGAEAMRVLALLSSRSGAFNRLNYWIFRSKVLSSLLYPLLRACRNLTLRLMGKSRINNLHLADNDRFL